MFVDGSGKITKIMDAAGISRSELARRLGVSYKTVYRWLDRDVKPHPAQRRELERIFREFVDLPGELYSVKKKFSRFLRALRTDGPLREGFIVESVYHSGALSGSRMSREDLRGILAGNKPRARELCEILESLNMLNAARFMLENSRPGFRAGRGYLMKLHEIIAYNFPGHMPGRFRSPGAAESGFQLRLNRLLKMMSAVPVDPVRESARCYAEMVSLRPFCGANGRVARMLVDTRLLSCGLPPAIIAFESKAVLSDLAGKASGGDVEGLAGFICERAAATPGLLAGCAGKDLYMRGQKTAPFMARMRFGRSVFRFGKPRASARGAS